MALILALDALNYVLVIALVATGLVVIFSLMNVINLAHGELFLLGAYTLMLAQKAGLGFFPGLILAPVVVGLIGLAIEELVIRHIYHRFLDAILATFGLSILIKQAVVLTFGPASHTVAAPLPGAVEVFGLVYPAYRLFVMAVAILVIGATFFLFFRTRFGLAARGVIANRNMAAALGVDTRRLDRLTFAAGAALAGLAGAVMAPLMSIDPNMGLGFLVPAFLSILIGGLGSLTGALIGASIIGGAETVFSNLWTPVAAQIVVFTLAVVVIRLFPQGIARALRRNR